ncbi:hypothetical protein [Brevibacillus sp. H7]|uniref:hypothetical protein n=1 Tax=Brevibacillus sp. H7 TaxID=3349138 RepID=UPI00381FF165
MGFDLGLIIALALSASATLSDYLRIPKKLRGWTAMFLIVALHMINLWLYNPAFEWKTALLESVTAGAAAVGIHSTAKNSMQQWRDTRKSKQAQDRAQSGV